MTFIVNCLFDFCFNAVLICLAGFCFGIRVTLPETVGVWLILKVIQLNMNFISKRDK